MNHSSHNKRIQSLFKLIEWLLFIFLCALSIHFVKDGLVQYQSKESNLAQSLKPITKLPTITICLNDNHVYEYYLDLNISYQALENTLPETLIENELNHFEKTNESVQVVKLNRECFKINSSIGLPLQRESFKVISLELDFNIYEETLPKKISIYFTSEENAYGAFNFVWKDGEAFEKNMKLGEYAVIELTPYEYFYLDDNDQCSHNSFIEQWQSHLLNANFEDCPRKCSSVLLPFDDPPFCGWTDDDHEAGNCANEIIHEDINKFRISNDHKRPCHILEYKGKVKFEEDIAEANLTKYDLQFGYAFTPPEMTIVYNEYLIFDTIGLIGSIGGTLGMCIGFSFSGLISKMFEFITSYYDEFH